MDRVVVGWSGGKDCVLALSELRDRADLQVVELMTTVDAERGRSAMHGVRRELYERQADALGLPIELVELPPEPSNETYARAMDELHRRYRERGIEAVAFGDLFLEDVRAYREEQLENSGIAGTWPLWGRDTAAVARAVLDAGYRATVVAADAEVFDREAVGRPFDEAFLSDLPAGVDPCGEHGEFHTFVHDGPGFASPVAVRVGRTVTRPVGEGEFHYADLLPVD